MFSLGLDASIKDQIYMLSEIPDTVRICDSSIPVATYGIQATQVIPKGAWIGPYEGKIISAYKEAGGLDTTCLWEVTSGLD